MLQFGGFEDPHEYPVATATHKAVEVYERMVVSMPRVCVSDSEEGTLDCI